MVRRVLLTLVFCSSLFVFDAPDADAARRRGLFNRIRANQTQRYNRARSTSARSNKNSTKLYQTHSSSAILDGFFGPYPGAEGHDRSWYVGR